MAFDFPSSPLTGQQFTPAGGPTYVWNGYGWSTLSGSLNSPAGALTLISSQTVGAAVASVDFTRGIDGTYDEYEIHIFGLTVSALGNISLRASSDAGSTWKQGAGDYSYQAVSQANPSGSSAFLGTSAAGGLIGAQGVIAGSSFAGVIRFFQPANTSNRKIFNYDICYTSGTFYHINGSVIVVADTAAINGVRIFNDAGNITGGTFNLYGVNKTGSPAVLLLDPATKTTVNPRRVKTGAFALSNGNLTLTKTLNDAAFYCACAHAEGRPGLKYFEAQNFGSAVSNMIGAGYANGSWETGSNYPGNGSNSMGFQSGFWFGNTAVTGGYPTWAVNDWIGLCFDTELGGAGVRNITQNGTWNNVSGAMDPGIGPGLLYPFTCLQQVRLVVIPCLYTFNAGWNLNFDGPFIGPVPTGAKRWGSGGP